MYDWLIGTPVWGERCIAAFETATLPAILAALQRVGGRVRFVVHTDQKERLATILNGFARELPPVPRGPAPHTSLGHANRQALAMARPGEAVALINADMVCSVELFEAAERRFAQGKRLVMMNGTRTAASVLPPSGANSRDLLKWAWHNRHPWIHDCTWGSGRTRTPSLVHFESGDNVVLHAFHLQPTAMLKDKDLSFPGLTADQDLIESFPLSSVHVVTSADEASFAEMSPRERQFATQADILAPLTIAAWASQPNKVTAAHRWLFTHRISLCGDDKDIGDAAVCADILDAIERQLSVIGGRDRFGPRSRPLARRRAS